MVKPTLLFVHGAWHSPECFKFVIPHMESADYICETVSMPSVRGNHPDDKSKVGVKVEKPVESLDEDIAAIKNKVLEILERGEDVVVNAHSWAGILVCSSLDGLSKGEREKEGKKNGVVKLTFVSAVLLPVGMSMVDYIGGRPDYWVISKSDQLAQTLYHALAPEDSHDWYMKLRPYALATFVDKARSVVYKKIPSDYLLCKEDIIIQPEVAESMVKSAREDGGNFQIVRLKASHSLYLTHPEAVADFIRVATGELLAGKDKKDE